MGGGRAKSKSGLTNVGTRKKGQWERQRASHCRRERTNQELGHMTEEKGYMRDGESCGKERR